MKSVTLLLGGCRSGKSRRALELGRQERVSQKIFIATCQPQDDEMRQRVIRHQKERSEHWTTKEVPLNLPEAVQQHSTSDTLVLIDCLTLWVSNLMFATDLPDEIDRATEKLCRTLSVVAGPLILVSNEVGAGIVPENDLARRYRDAVGWVNQRVAAVADHVIWMVAGIEVKVK